VNVVHRFLRKKGDVKRRDDEITIKLDAAAVRQKELDRRVAALQIVVDVARRKDGLSG
jgi:hypothetical protein